MNAIPPKQMKMNPVLVVMPMMKVGLFLLQAKPILDEAITFGEDVGLRRKVKQSGNQHG
jgi:hypothetical protein